jgi:hypothetical protein
MSSSVPIVYNVTTDLYVCTALTKQVDIDYQMLGGNIRHSEWWFVIPSDKDKRICGILFVIFMVFWPISVYKFWKRRHLEPIRGRHPNISIIQSTAWCLFTCWNMISFLTGLKMPCVPTIIVPQLLTTIALAVFIVRILILLVDTALAKSAIEYHRMVMRQSQQHFQRESKTDTGAPVPRLTDLKKLNNDWWIHHRHWFNDRVYISLVVVITSLFIIPLIISEFVMGYGLERRVNPQCLYKTVTVAAYIEAMSFGAHFITAAVFLFFRKGIKENLGIQQECGWQIVVITAVFLHDLPLYIGNDLRRTVILSFCNWFHFNGFRLLSQYFPQFIFLVASVTWPTIQTYDRSRWCKRQSSQVSDHRLEEQREFVSKNPLKELEWLLSLPEGFEAFKLRLQEELSVENLLFW